MKKLIKTINEIENILTSLEVVLKKEYHNLLNPKISIIDNLESIEEKKILFKKYIILNQDRLFLEKKYHIFAPYQNNNELNNNWNNILKKFYLLKELNFKNKILINKRYHLNQCFLELFSTYKTAITYNFNGNVKI
ncbi:flagellar biosynthesis protein FlgN [Buchnera aphidicola (Acyrthosiphon lactucae)]|uniref:Flagellar biosynthesis protein FlgN n=1 Tax=Buchnera aphidicola (Acyrthosiphon lactucae) TaxID=1241832 RepID=A0A4D6XQ45_9GAMM|nr:flagellar export chaperone FlgN [Buchnera aphidicola]QCI17729.1 flagellar biosynthesis protein FlgN [Buchnera aphidicola (Acyrthosiphon lactucae)]